VVNEGWKCPECGTIWAPSVSECPRCKPKEEPLRKTNQQLAEEIGRPLAEVIFGTSEP
jgi:hypothetical protein